jgi:drug/metabolite transporter (DMT)-like permease
MSDGRTYAAFGGAVLIGGANFVGVSLSNAELAPLFGATLRFAVAATCFLVIARAMRVPGPRGRPALGAVVYGLLGFGVAYALLYYALVGLAAGTTAVIMALVPLFTLIIAVIARQERLSVRGVVGGILAVTGIAILSMGTLGGDLSPSYLIAAILGAVAAAASSVVAKAFPEVHPLNMNAIGMVSGTVLLALGSLLLGEPWALPREPRTVAAVAWLALFGSVGLFQLFLYVIRRWSASAAVYALAAMPVVAVVLGALMLAEPITSEVLAGGVIVIAAVYVGAVSRSRPVTVLPESLASPADPVPPPSARA